MSVAVWVGRSVGFLNVALGAYALAWVTSLVAAFRPDERETRDPRDRWPGIAVTVVATIAWLLHGAGLFSRWAAGGVAHPPWTTLYETLITLSWGLATLVLALPARRRPYGSLAGDLSVATPLTAILLVLAKLQPQRALELLGPSLQSRWLFAHVLGAAVAYTCLAAGAALSLLVLLKDRLRSDVLQLGSSGLGLLVIGWAIGWDLSGAAGDSGSAATVSALPGGIAGVTLAIAFAVWLAHWTVGAYAATFAPAPATVPKSRGVTAGPLGEPGERLDGLYLTLRASFAAGAAALWLHCFALIAANGGAGGFRLATHPYRFAGFLLAAAAATFALAASRGRASLERKLPATVALDRAAYRVHVAGFLALTLAIACGAAWADQVWGQYWSWDPKQTWALVTWFFYAIYLHVRLMPTGSARKSAALSLFGLVFLAFAFLGVNLLLTTAHSFASGS